MGEIFLQDGKIPFSWLLPLLGETILVLGETMWAKLVMGETRYNPTVKSQKTLNIHKINHHISRESYISLSVFPYGSSFLVNFRI